MGNDNKQKLAKRLEVKEIREKLQTFSPKDQQKVIKSLEKIRQKYSEMYQKIRGPTDQAKSEIRQKLMRSSTQNEDNY